MDVPDEPATFPMPTADGDVSELNKQLIGKLATWYRQNLMEVSQE